MGPLTFIGSAETSPGMVRVHRRILNELPPRPMVAFIDTPYGFQENASDITEKVHGYFETSLNQSIETATLKDADHASPAQLEAFRQTVSSADYVFSGPGSPSYALKHWTTANVRSALLAGSSQGHAISLASAAAATAGPFAVPVYEIYKVGAQPHWIDGLSLTGPIVGFDAIVIPHWDNADGGNHDTRYCYLGRRRLEELIAQLPYPTPIIGVDEHTAVTFSQGTMTVEGQGHVTIMHGVSEERFGPGQSFALSDVFALDKTISEPAAAAEAGGTSPMADFDRALVSGDALAAADAILAGGAVTEGSSTQSMIVRLARLSQTGMNDPADVIRPFVDLIIDARDRARSRSDYEESDRLRDALIAAGIEIHDGADGTQWSIKA